MIKYVVVEDEENIQAIVRKVLRKISILNDETLQTEYFKRFNQKLKNEINDTSIRKVYILDIELEGKVSGLEIAQMIREVDWDSEIIFITSHDKMFETVHRNILEVFDFIEKFLNLESRLEADINKIYKRKYDKKLLKIENRSVDLEIYYKNITYIVRDKEERKTIIHTNAENNHSEFKVNLNLNELMPLLDKRFIQVHRSCIVNKERVSEYNFAKGYFILDNGDRVDYLSKKYRKVVE